MLKTLYVHRPLLNGEEVIEWAKSQGISKTIPANDMHVTLVFSKQAVDWDKFEPFMSRVTIINGPRSMEKFGLIEKNCVVLRFNCAAFKIRNEDFIAGGCSTDFPDYKSHITLTYDGLDLDVEKMTPYTGNLVFGPEVFKEVDLDWNKKIKEE